MPGQLVALLLPYGGMSYKFLQNYTTSIIVETRTRNKNIDVFKSQKKKKSMW